ncbi:hypothetical protein BDF22DRAFT_677063 [Syncephalis plumigaleata]|nr:hypothetical protein BDF22DRAFT_677063 [Syncephalis plumigaleata]
MNFFVHLSLCLVLLISWYPIATVNGVVVINTSNGTMTLPSSDYFYHPPPHYTRNGTGILWPIARNSTDCSFMTVNKADESVQMAAQSASRYPDLILFVYWSKAAPAGCYTLAQLGLAVEKTSKELVDANFPPINLIVVMQFSNNTAPIWGPPAIPVALLDQWASTTFYKKYNPAVDLTFHVTAEEELGPWNEIFLAPGFITYQWLYFSLIFQIITDLMSVLSFDLILFYWSIRGQRMIANYILIGFRVLLGLHMLTLIICTIFPIMLNLTWQLDEPSQGVLVVTTYIMPNITLISMIIFAIFAIWFSWCAYRVKRHPMACYRFIQLSVFSALASIAYAISTAQNYYVSFTPRRAATQTIEVYIVFYVLNHTVLLIRSLICLSILGLNWPTISKATGPRLVLTGAQTVPDEETAIENSWSSRFWQQIIAYFGPQSNPNTAVATANSQGKLLNNQHQKNLTSGMSNNTSAQDESSVRVEQLGETMYIETIPDMSHQVVQSPTSPPRRNNSLIVSEEVTVQVIPATITHLGTINDITSSTDHQH